MNLTDAQIRGFKPSLKRLRKSDGGGLFIDVMPTGKKIFRLAYRFGGKQRTLVVGEYPMVKLADARLKAAQYKLSLRNGIDPQTTLKPKMPEAVPEPAKGPLWRDVAKDYLVLRDRSGGALATLRKLTRQVEVTIEALGAREISSLTAMDVLSVVNPIAERGKVETAHEIRTRFSQIFRFAAARGLVAYDPASVTIDAMIPRGRGEFAGLTDPKAVGQLMLDIRQYTEKHIWVGSALLISAYLFPRNTEQNRYKSKKLETKCDKLADMDRTDEDTMRAVVADVLKVSELLKSLTELYENANLHEKARIAKILIVELLIDENMAQTKPQIGMKPIFEQSVSLGAGTDWFSELLSNAKMISDARETLSNLVQ